MAAAEQFSNAASTTLSAAITTTNGTSLTVASAAAFPSAAQYRIIIDSEILLVTAGAGTTTWTVTRGVEGTTAATHSLGAPVVHVLTSGAIGQAFARLDQNNTYTAVVGNTGFQLSPTITASGAKGYGFYTSSTLTAAANNDTLYNEYGSATIATGTFTGLTAIGIGVDAAAWTKTGTGTIANAYGLYVTTPTIGTNNYPAVFMGGNVGVGVAAPTASVHAQRTDGGYQFQLDSQKAGQVRVWALGVRGDNGGLTFDDVTGGVTRMMISTTGQVGIGTTTPSAPLHVLGSGQILTEFDSSNTGVGAVVLQNTSVPRTWQIAAVAGTAPPAWTNAGGLYVYDSTGAQARFAIDAFSGAGSLSIKSGGHLVTSGPTPTLGALQTGITSQSIGGTDLAMNVSTNSGASPPGAFNPLAIVNFGASYVTGGPRTASVSQNPTNGVISIYLNSTTAAGFTILGASAYPANATQAWFFLSIL